MKQFHKPFLTILFVFAACVSLMAQNRFFSEANQSELNKITGKRTIVPQKYKAVTVNSDELKTFLWSLPSEKNVFNRNLAPVMELPMPDGSSAKFRVWESSIQEPGLEAKFPEIRTFLGQGITDPYATIRFDYTDFGFHAQVLSVNGNIYMDPYARGNVNNYISYYGKDNSRQTNWTCEVAENLGAKAASTLAPSVTGPCRGTQLYTYRLAVGCTHQYAQAVGGTTPALLHSAIVTTVNRVVGVYETEVTVRMVLVANNNIIEFLTTAGDPYTGNDDANVLINESQTVITNAIGSANFDIGHTFSTGGGGLAGLGVVCNNGQKAAGITGSPNPVGDDYDIDYVAHEMGHQFGGNHTFNSTTSNCGGGNRNASTAYEPGSGTTIMAYAGICTSDDIQPHSDPYFHTVSFDEISNFIEAGGASCRAVTPTGNTLPQIVTMDNNTANIPLSTPFTLTGTATDANGDALTYNWEEWDLGTGGAWNNGAASTTAPLFKSRIPKTTGSRTFPDIARIIANYLPANPPGVMGGLKGETLPTVARAMKFRLTVRDNRAGGGGIVTGGNGCQTGFTGVFQVNTIAATGPFIVTVPNGGESYAGGSTQTITWNVAGTGAAPISVANVKISLSTDGGLTYPTVISASTANDGSEALTIPSIATTTARVKVEAVGNIFFDISNANFTITAAAQTYTFNSVAPASVGCGTASASITLGTTASGGFSTPIILSATGLPGATTIAYAPSPVTPGNSSVVTLSGMNTLAPGTYNVTITGTAGAVVQNTVLAFTVQPGTPPSITTQPAAVTVCAGDNATFTVVAPGAGLSYQWQVSTGGPFSDITGANTASYTITGVTAGLNNNQYHVIVSTLCGTTTTVDALLTVNAATAINTQPANAAVCAGSNNTFTVVAAGTNLGYQWQVSPTGCGGPWANIPGATTSSYTISGVTVGQDGSAYQCVITGTCAPLSIISNCALLTVTGSVNITTQPADLVVCSGSNAVFNVAASGAGVNYQWQVSTGGPFNDIPGETNATLTLTGVTAGLNGNQYQAVVTNTSCATGSTSAIATLTVNATPAVTTQPSDVSVCVGTDATFTSVATGTNITYQWQVSAGGPFSDIAGATSASYTVVAPTAAMNNYQYHVIVSGTCTPAATSANGTLTVVSPATIQIQPGNSSACEGNAATFTVTGASAATDLYQWQVSTGGPFNNIPGETNISLTLTGLTLAMNGNQYQVILSNNACPGSVTSTAGTLTVNAAPTVSAATASANVCTGSQVQLTASGAVDYSWTPAGSLNDPNSATPTATPVVDPGNPGVPLNIVYTVTGTGANSCTSSATVTVTANPLLSVTLTATPSVTSLLPGESVLLTATVTPAGTYTYTWFKDAIALSNSGNTLNVNAGEVGAYAVIADGGAGFCAQSSNIITVTDSVASNFYIYPNPNEGQFTVDIHNPGGLPIKRSVVVYDGKGARVFIKAVATSSELEHVRVDMRPAATGTYVVVVYDASGTMLSSDRVVVRY